jgi:hypothetical protein
MALSVLRLGTRSVTDTEPNETIRSPTCLGQLARDPDKAVLIEHVEPCDDGSGNYEPWIKVTMRSGAVLLVAVTVLE